MPAAVDRARTAFLAGDRLDVDEILTRFWEHLGGRTEGPMTLRLVMQPSVAAFLAVRDGLRDARDGRPAYLWAVATSPGRRRELLRQTSKSLRRIALFAAAIDLVYQLRVFGRVHPLELVLVAFVLAVVPYVLLRGPVNRVARRARSERGANR